MSSPVIILFIASAGWGLTWLPIKYFNENGLMGPELVFVAFGTTAVVLLPFFLIQFSHWRNYWVYVALIAFFGGLANISYQLAMSYGDVVRVMILFYLLPVWSVIGGYVFLKEELDRIRILAVVLALAGAFLILGAFKAFESPPSWIDLLAIMAGFALAMNNITFRACQPLSMTSKISAMFIGCSLMMGLYLLGSEQNTIAVDTTTVGLAALYGLLWLSLITLGTQWALTEIGAGRASIIIVTELVVAVVSSALILKQWLTWTELIGAIMVVSAAMLEGLRTDTSETPKANI